MKTVEQILDILDEHGFTVHEYYEDKELCGYEIESWTDDLGINMLHLIDCRATSCVGGVTPENVRDELRSIYECFDAEEETAKHWDEHETLRYFGILRLLDDFENYESKLRAAVLAVSEEEQA